MWHAEPESKVEFPYNGRFQKMESLLAAYATAVFNDRLATYIPEKAGSLPIFDARAFVVPNLMEAYNEFLWRQQDATKNAISMAAQSMFSHKELQNKNGNEMQEMMWQAHGVNFNNYPAFFKRGTFARRVTKLKTLTEEELEKIPVEHRPTGPVERSSIELFDYWLGKERDTMEIVFEGV